MIGIMSPRERKRLQGRFGVASGHVLVLGFVMVVGSGCYNFRYSAAMADYERWERVQNTLEKGSSQDVMAMVARMGIRAKDGSGSTVLHYAAASGREEAVGFLLSKGADPNALNLDGATPLFLAAGNGHVGVVKLLLKHGVPIDEPKKWTPLLYAANHGKTEVVKLLIEKGASVTAKGENGQTLLHEAADSGVKELVELAIDVGIGVNSLNKNGGTPLHAAARNQKDGVEAVELLLSKGAQVNATVFGNTPLHFAAATRAQKVAQILLEKGADVNARSQEGETPLHDAVSFPFSPYFYDYENEYIEIVKMLLDKGADINAVTNKGGTALDLATAHHHMKVVALLEKRGGLHAEEIKKSREGKDEARGGK
jgi:ankyrin repeat protein